MIHYYPFTSGRYEISAGLQQLGKDFGNGVGDQLVFQIDNHWLAYRQEKLASRAERLSKYYCRDKYDPEYEKTINEWLVRHLIKEHPQHFIREERKSGCAITCALSSETLIMDSAFDLIEVHAENTIEPFYASTCDALASQLQEDLAVVHVDNNHDHLVLLHLCLPNHWAAEDKIGKGFIEVHDPVPGLEKINRASQPLLKSLITGGPYVRFAWGLATDTRLNHHPVPPSGISETVNWTGRSFTKENPELYVRVERQVITGFPKIHSFLFTIRTYFEDIRDLNREKKIKLAKAIKTMDADSLKYKGIYQHKSAILHWIETLIST